MSPYEFGNRLNKKINSLEKENIPFKIAVQTVHALRMERIFTRGETASGGQIGQYSTKPIYINPKNSPSKFAGKGKNQGRTSKKDARKTRYFPGGYKEFRAFVHRPSARIDLGLFYDLRFDLSNSKTLGNPGKAEKISPHEYIERLKRPKNVHKLSGLEERFGNIGGFQNKERAEFSRVLQFELIRFLQ